MAQFSREAANVSSYLEAAEMLSRALCGPA
jgi:hypothetical protein